MTTWTETTNYLIDRGNHYGLSAQDLLNQTPDLIQNNPAAILTFWQDKDISHVLPKGYLQARAIEHCLEAATHRFKHVTNEPVPFFPEGID